MKPTSPHHLCNDCLRSSPLEALHVALDYHKPYVHRLIHKLKYENIQNLSIPLSEILLETLPYSPDFETTLFIPIPIHPKKLSQRGYNQSKLIAQGLSPERKNQETYLVKVKQTRPQMKLNREQRLKNLEGAFALSTQIPENIERIIIIDDVTTTLSTLYEVAKTVQKHTKVPIIGLVLAHNEDTSHLQDKLI